MSGATSSTASQSPNKDWICRMCRISAIHSLPLLIVAVCRDRHVERFQRSVKTSEDAMRIMQERMIVFQKAFAGPVKQNWQKMGLAFKTLQASFENDDNPSESD